MHAAFQIAWALAMTAPLVAKVSALASRPTGDAALSIIAVSAIWALVAALAWALRVTALMTSGRWGRRTRSRVHAKSERRIERSR